MAMVDVDGSCQFSAYLQPKSTCLLEGWRPPSAQSTFIKLFRECCSRRRFQPMTASSSASWSRFSPPSNFVNEHVSAMWFMVFAGHNHKKVIGQDPIYAR